MQPIPSLLHSELSVFFTQSMYFVNESETMALVTIEASGVSQESYTVTISVNPGTATCEQACRATFTCFIVESTSLSLTHLLIIFRFG